MSDDTFEIFLQAPPGLEPLLAEEAREKGFAMPEAVPGGVVTRGGWEDVWRANLELRGAGRVLVRIGSFMAFHLAQLDKRARKFPWAGLLRPGERVRVDVSCRRSKIYHAGAAKQRIETALEAFGARIAGDTVQDDESDAEAGIEALTLKVRIEDNEVIFSLDSSGAPLHRRGTKQFVGKAPMRETLAALFLRACGYDGREPVYDPMCGSGTFVLEAASIATGRASGLSRGFAFERLASFDATRWQALRDAAGGSTTPELRFAGSDRDAGAVAGANANAARAGLGDLATFHHAAVSDATPPEGPPGLVIVNPPYGGRIGNKKLLYGLHGALGETLRRNFKGWRVGIVTSEAGLARATGLSVTPWGPPVPHGGLKITLFTAPPIT
ncbi:class I SAM-dependent RNA methyltransferase [Limimaricola sp. G21655-S1]|uniref:THUMP domain-containing class I SAM-dependent RNA methyltransferase n=1 Tax=Limimaricola sp. G21655-S1 TaxID=3014768 RepID=UPI0022AEBA71|nr:class I SAM-dependent RNA methyltransferase [Limimaricola sp. G21655-S1]MCZ4262623.1 class I SAM-dependent RNA methyltransferase [Limimaricola sp. G21655-S1]